MEGKGCKLGASNCKNHRVRLCQLLLHPADSIFLPAVTSISHPTQAAFCLWHLHICAGAVTSPSISISSWLPPGTMSGQGGLHEKQRNEL